MTTRLLIAPAAAGKTYYCLEQIRAIRTSEPVAPIWVILADALQVYAFRRRLAAQGGAFNVQVVTFHTLYAELLALAGQALPRLDEPVLHRLLQTIVDRLAADGQLTYYAPLRDKPGFNQALRAIIRELKRSFVEPAPLADAVQAAGPRLAELALIYGRYQAWLQQANWADDEGRGWLAELALRQRPDLCAGWRLLVVDGFDQFNPTQLRLLARLAEQARDTLVTLTGAPAPRPAHRRFLRAQAELVEALDTAPEPLPGTAVQLAPTLAHLESTLFERPPRQPSSAAGLTLLELPDRAHEVRAALRWLKERHLVDGLPLHRLAVLARGLEPYRPFLVETAAEFGLPLQLVEGERLSRNPAVAALLDLVSLSSLNWPRRQLLEAWRSPYFDWRDEGIGPIDADRLEAAAHEGQVIGGLDQWRDTLAQLARAASLEDLAEIVAEDLAETAVTTPPRGAEAAALRRKLDAFVHRLQPEPAATVRQYVQWLEHLIGDDPELAPGHQPWRREGSLGVVWQARYGPQGERLPTAAMDVAALQRLKDVLRGLLFAEMALSDGAPEPRPFGQFWQELRAAVEAASYQPPVAARETLLAAPLLAARGLAFDAVALLGLAEGEFPRPLPHQPLLREPDRAFLAERAIRLEAHDSGDEITLFYEAVTRARRQLLVTRPYLADDGQPWEPSPFWTQLVERGGVTPARSRSAEPLPPAAAASPPELLAALAHGLGRPGPERAVIAAYLRRLPESGPLLAAWEQIQAGAAVLSARLADSPRGPHEGDLAPLAARLAARYDPERPWSASRLESYAICGFAFLVAYGLGFESRQPVAAGFDVRQLGSMYHAILEELYRQVEQTGEPPLALLPAIAEAVLANAPERYGFRPTPLWQQQRAELIRNLQATVAALEAESAGWQPLQLEAAFGFNDIPPLRIADEQGRSLPLRGYIDRVDVAADGRIRVIDYKSGGSPISSAGLSQGKRIQLALYALAARDVLDMGEPADGFYWHIASARPSYLRLAKQEGGVPAAIETAVRHALDFAAAIRQGAFAPQPPDGGCPPWCPAADFCWRYTGRAY